VRCATERHHAAIGRVILKYLSDEYLFSKDADQEILAV